MARACLAFLLAFLGALCPTVLIAEQTPPSASIQTQASVPSHNGPLGPGYVGDAACVSCHKNQSVAYPQTTHQLTSQPPSKTSILGSFSKGSNTLMIRNPAQSKGEHGLYFKMDAKPDGFYVTAVSGWPPELQQRSERIDVVVGAGVCAQTYLYWHGNQVGLLERSRCYIASPNMSCSTCHDVHTPEKPVALYSALPDLPSSGKLRHVEEDGTQDCQQLHRLPHA